MDIDALRAEQKQRFLELAQLDPQDYGKQGGRTTTPRQSGSPTGLSSRRS